MGGKGYEKDLFIIFRGSTDANNNADWISNARIGVQLSSNSFPVHIGFNEIFKSMLPSIKNFIDDNKGNIENIHCIGHSLGGAIATLAADWVKTSLKRNVKLYAAQYYSPSNKRITPAMLIHKKYLISQLRHNRW